MSNYNKHKHTADNNTRKQLLRLVPLILVLAVIPLIFRLYQYDTGLQEYDFFSKNGISSEFALHGKMVAFIAVGAAMLILTVIRCAKNREFPFTKALIPLFVYGVLALLSCMCSKYGSYPWTGGFEQFEPGFALLGYVIAAYYAFVFTEDERDVRLLVNVLAAGACILVLIGLTQALDCDILSTKFGRWLTIPSKYYSQLSGTGEEFGRKFKVWRVFMTFSNPNYVGSYVPLVSPLILVAAFDAKELKARIAYAALYAGLIICLFGSGSKTGFVGLIVSMVIVAVYLAGSGRKKVIFSITGAFLVLLCAYVMFGNNDYLRRIKSVFNIEKTEYTVNGIETLDRGVRIVYKNNGLTVSFNPERLGFSCTDDSGGELYMSLNDSNKLVIEDPRFEGITLGPVELADGVTGFEINATRAWYFARIDGEYYYYTPYGKFIKHRISEAWEPLDRHGLLATGRGFLWARTVPLLKNNLILGSGADTFVFEYPNADFVSGYNSGNWGYVVTKPHCMYLQIAVQTGLLSLLAFLTYYVMFAAGSIKALKQRKTASSGIIWAILAGTAGYMVAAIFNDSTIAIAPLFWTLTGIGLALGAKIRTE